MKAWEICKKENVGKKYKDNNGDKWEVRQAWHKKDIYDLYDSNNYSINYNEYTISQLAEMDFEEDIDWSKVPVDTKVLVRDKKDEGWNRKYFAKYKDGRVYTWTWGKTCFDDDGNEDVIDWEYAKLYNEGDE